MAQPSDKSRLTTTALRFSLANDAINAQIVNTDTNVLTFSGVGGSAAVTLTNLANPVSVTDAVNKQYVDTIAHGLSWKEPVVVASVSDLTLSGSQTIDGVGVANGSRVLVKDQSTPVDNGIYVTDSGAWTRSTDLDTGSDASGDAVFVQQGSVNADKAFVCTSDPGIVGTNPLSFQLFASLNPGTASGATGSIQYNNGGGFGGVSYWSSNGTTTMSATTGGSLTMADNATIVLGSASNLTLTNDGTDSSITNTSGEFYIENTASNILFKLGTTDASTAVGVFDSSDNVVFSVSSNGDVNTVGTINSTNEGGTSSIGSTVNSFSTNDGAFVVFGGVGIGKNLNVGGDIVVTGSTTMESVYLNAPLVSQSTIQANEATFSSLSVSGSVVAGGTLVAGDTTLTSLDVVGNTILQGTLAAGASTFDSAATEFLSVSGSATLNALSVVTDAFVQGTFVAGATTLNSLSTNFIEASGAVTVNSLEVVNGATVQGQLVAGDTTLSSLAVTNDVQFNSVTAATSTTDGALTVAGGVGIVGDLHVGGTAVFNGLDINGSATLDGLDVTGPTILESTLTAGESTLAALAVTGDLIVGGSISFVELDINGTENSFSTTDGAVTVAGGVGIAKNLNVGGNFGLQTSGTSILFGEITQSSLGFNGTDTVLNVSQGNVVIDFSDAENLNSNIFEVVNTGYSSYLRFEQSDNNKGVLFVGGIPGDGGGAISAAGTITAGGNVISTYASGTNSFASTTQSTAANNGALTVAGGVGILKNLNVDGAASMASLNVAGSTVLNSLTAVSSTMGGLTVNGDVYAVAFNATSDATLKTNIEQLGNSLEQLKRVEGYSYNWADSRMGETLQYGVLAQQLEEAGLGHLVAKGNHKSVNYLGLIPVMIEAIKELSDKLDLKKDLF